ncbi:iron complex outermembrane recepter protein [Chitinophaga jiangningensis]|uniref:Iron complex outermembrane recepter protein n=1 Tax=Chitinophaga jiangningensis TaxID=1419482 RepID=A0A1M6ZXG4_9BACT|nr:TonB-dependent receptor [Chitinophaga jiangningensis]SHL35171.1 iron complex outermembrane recepter protein [Chitinophaga jiangningensis]
MRNHLLLLPALVLTQQLQAQHTETKDSSRQLNGVVIYQAGKNTPVTYQNLDMTSIREKNTGQEPSFLLTATPAVTNYSDAGNQQGYSYYRIRGIDQTRINTTLDGMPLNEPEDQGAYFSNYPDLFTSLSAVQIQRGTGTSKNGAASYAGSVQLFSPDLKDPQSTTFGLGYGSYNSFRAFAEHKSGVKNNKAFYARASQIYTDGYKDHAFNNSQSAFVSGAIFLPKSTWKVNLMAGHQQNGMAWLPVADTLIAKNRKTNANTKAEKDEFLQSLLQVQHQWQPNNHSILNSSVYYTYLNGGYGMDVNNYYGEASDGNLFHYNFRSHFAGIFSNYTLYNDHFSWTTGIHANLYTRRHLGKDDALGELYRNRGNKNEASASTRLEYRLQRFTFFGDLQYRYVTFDYIGSVGLPQVNWQFLNPRGGIDFAANDHLSFYYSIGKTSREPTRNDMFAGNDDLPIDSSAGKPIINKDPESVIDQELGLKIKCEKFALQLNGYYMNFHNEIVLNGQIGPNGLLLTNNVNSSYRTGVELSATYQLSKSFTLTNNSAYNHSVIKEDKTTFKPVLTPSLIINQEVAYHHRQWVLAVTGRYQSSAYIDFANTAQLDGYFLLNARAQYSLQRYTFSVFVNNVTNAHYYNNGATDGRGNVSYFVQAPANFYAAVKYSF